jgi:hypothetical protein
MPFAVFWLSAMRIIGNLMDAGRVRDSAACSAAGVRKPPKEMLWGGGEDIASIVADVNRWSTPCRSVTI